MYENLTKLQTDALAGLRLPPTRTPWKPGACATWAARAARWARR